MFICIVAREKVNDNDNIPMSTTPEIHSELSSLVGTEPDLNLDDNNDSTRYSESPFQFETVNCDSNILDGPNLKNIQSCYTSSKCTKVIDNCCDTSSF